MARLADLLEDYRNLVGRANWSIGRDIDAMSGYDPDLAEFVERSSLGTGAHGLGAGGLAGMIKASHGSPHAFTKFDFSKIGTGEGAQAYGHGGYFAQGFDSPIAKQYQENVKDMASIQAINDRMKELSRIMSSDEIAGQYRKFKSDIGRNAADEYDALMEQRDVIRTDPGHLYNVELRWPDAAREAADPLGEHHLFEWHTPLDELSAKDAEIINPLLNKLRSQPNPSLFKNVQTAGDVIKYAQALKLNPAEEISKAGYPGIKYLDQASRGAGQGTRNYVMFDDALANIVSRNGVSLSDLLRR